MAKADYETWIVEKGVRGGKPYARRHPLQVPLLLATGRYEKLSDLQLREARNDLDAEHRRRTNERA